MFRPTFVALCVLSCSSPSAQAQGPEDIARPLRILVLGDHPSSCDLFAGGAGAAWADRGHHVRFGYVSMAEAERDPDGALHMRRGLEARDAGRALGVEYMVIDDPSGDSLIGERLTTRLERELRDFVPDVVIAPDPARSLLGVAVGNALHGLARTQQPAVMYFLDSARPGAKADLVVPVEAQAARKRRALETHRATPYVFEPVVHSAAPATIAVKRAVALTPIPAEQRDALTEAFVFAENAAPDASTRSRLSLDAR